jgi:predicted DNA-binding transcriptional regulator AlpA
MTNSLGEMEARQLAEKALADYPMLMSARQVSGVLGVSRASVYRLADRGDFRKTKVRLTGDQPTIRFLRSSVVDLLTVWLRDEA